MCLAVAFLGGTSSRDAAEFAVSALSLAVLVRSVARRRPRCPRAWHLLIGSLGAFLVGSATTIVPELVSGRSPAYPSVSDAVDVIGYLAAVAAGLVFLKSRSRSSDPTSLLDAVIVTGSVAALAWAFVIVPELESIHETTLVRSTNLTFSILSFVLIVLAACLAVGPGIRNGSWYWLVSGITCAFASDIVLSIWSSTDPSSGLVTASNLLATGGFVSVAVAATRPSMVELTEPGDFAVAALNSRRLALMVAALLTVPALLLARVERPSALYTSGIVSLWGILALVVVARMASLVRLRERMALTEGVLHDAGRAIVASTGPGGMFDAALAGALRLVRINGATGVVCIGLATGRHLEVESVASTRFGSLSCPQEGLCVEFLVEIGSSQMYLSGADAPGLGISLGATWVGLFPLEAFRLVPRVLTVSADRPLPSFGRAACVSLARTLSVAVARTAVVAEQHQQEAERGFQERMARSEAHFRALVQNSSDVIAIIDGDGTLGYVSASVRRVLGYDSEELVGQALQGLCDLVDDGSRQALEAGLGRLDGSHGRVVVTCRVRDRAGVWRTFDCTFTDLRDEPAVGGIVCNARDVTDRVALEHSLRHQALHDELTGLANRVLFKDRVEHALSRRNDRGAGTTVLFVDIDDFKTVNDSLGHAVGDLLLQVVATRLKDSCRIGDTAGRLGGDEFAILLENARDLDDALSSGRRMLGAISQPIEIQGRLLTVTASIGAAYSDGGSGYTSDVLLRNADAAMYQAKSSGKGRIASFHPSMHAHAYDRLELKADLATAIAHGDFVLHYQPIVALATNAITGFEALLRWQHPQRGLLPPDSFIPLAEETGLIAALGRWALETALAQLADWQRRSRRLVMNVNMSARQLDAPQLVDDVACLLVASGVNAGDVTIELTETLAVGAAAALRLDALCALGVQLAADDFGSGEASYAVLQRFGFSSIKIDKTLIDGLCQGARGKAVAQVCSIVDMAHASDLTVVAEGIESREQGDLLRALGCDYGQGFYFGRPGDATLARGTLTAAESHLDS